MSSEFDQNIKNRGQAGAVWVKRIPEIISKKEEEWQIKVHDPFDLTWNYVAPAVRSNGTQAVLKIGFPTDREFTSEIDALQIFNGDGIEQLLEQDRDNFAILIEKVVPGRPLSELDNDEEATKILASVMKKLWKPLPQDHTFITLAEWTNAIKEYLDEYKDTKGPFSYKLVEKANYLFEELISTSAEPMLVHGDLHQDNVLSSQRDSWLAIDPKGVAAEPAYETAAMIRNPYVRMKNNPDIKRILRRRIQILSEELGFDPQRILKWGFAQTMLSAVWGAETSERRWEHALSVAQTLDDLKV
jgi:streptomycin 6-kinase